MHIRQLNCGKSVFEYNDTFGETGETRLHGQTVMHPCTPVDIDIGGLLAGTRFRSALAELLRAHYYSQETGGNCWEFAVEIRHLARLGLTDNDLRLLVRINFLDFAQEITDANANCRQFQAAGNLAFGARTCFVLTSLGVAKANGQPLWSSNPTDSDLQSAPLSPWTRPPIRLPIWNAEHRLLSYADRIVKHFKRCANNQEIVLHAFQEESWPLRIDDPLAPRPCQDLKRRLNDTIKCLNRGQKHRLLQFRGDGTGEGVTWEIVE